MHTHRTLRLAILVMTAAALCWGQATQTVTASYNGYPVPILPDDYDTVGVAFITVPQALKITSLTVKVTIAYPQVGDLRVRLYAPDGTDVMLLDHNCGELVNVDTTFDDAAPSKYSDFCPTEAGRGPFRPNEALADFVNADSSIGVWTLAVENDTSDSRAGSVKDVTLTITGTSQAQPYFRSDQVLNSANGRSGVVSPGQIVSIAGTNLGPTESILTKAGDPWLTTLGDVTVKVNGTAVPIRYVSSSRIDVQMPFTLASTASIQVQYGSNTSGVVAVPVQGAFPGVFAQNTVGTGLARAGNQDWTPNSASNPAARGTYIYVYATGLGTVDPPATAGAVPPQTPLYNTVNPVTATIGGKPATVGYAGLAPGIVGPYQLNILVPDDAPSGAQELIINSGGYSSQTGLIIYVAQ